MFTPCSKRCYQISSTKFYMCQVFTTGTPGRRRTANPILVDDPPLSKQHSPIPLRLVPHGLDCAYTINRSKVQAPTCNQGLLLCTGMEVRKGVADSLNSLGWQSHAVADIEANQAMLVWMFVEERVQPFSLDRQLARIAACAATTATAARGTSLVPGHLEIARHIQVLHRKPVAFASGLLRKHRSFGLDQRVHCTVRKIGTGWESQSRQVVALVW